MPQQSLQRRRRARAKKTAGRRFAAALALCLLAAPAPLPAQAASPAAEAEPAACATMRLAEPGWTDIAATSALAGQVLQALGYQTEVRLLSVPITFSAMSTGEVDVFLGLWRPTMTADARPYLENGSIETVRTNLAGAQFGLAVPDYLYAAGLRRYSDIARFGDALGHKIYAIEPGNDANRILLDMVDKNAENLGDFSIKESSEPAMLVEAAAAIEDKRPIIFVAWQPHPMNARFKIRYLGGGEAYFGGAAKSASVETVVRKNYLKQCPNAGHFLQNLAFTLAGENALMAKIMAGEDPDEAAKAWLRANPQILAAWLDGVKTRAGAPALPAAEKAFAAP